MRDIAAEIVVLIAGAFLLALLIFIGPAAAAEPPDWPFPEFTRQADLQVKAQLDEASLAAVSERSRKYVLVEIPLAEVRGTLADVEAAAVGGEDGLRQLETVRTTATRIYMTRGDEGARWIPLNNDIRTYPTEVVIDLDKSRLLIFSKMDLRLAIPGPADWRLILEECVRWSMAAEGR